MALRTPCSRHARSVWIASCADCTAWHLAGALADRDRDHPAPGAAGSPPEPRDPARGSGEAEAA
ncbi:hypothetical protein ACI79C_16715 [Geodermatophilus sp. SYSU D00697]